MDKETLFKLWRNVKDLLDGVYSKYAIIIDKENAVRIISVIYLGLYFQGLIKISTVSLKYLGMI